MKPSLVRRRRSPCVRRGSCRKPVPFHEKRTAPHIRLVGRQRFEAVLYARPCAVLRIRTKKKKKKEKRRSIYKFMRRSTVFIFNHSFIQHNSTQLNPACFNHTSSPLAQRFESSCRTPSPSPFPRHDRLRGSPSSASVADNQEARTPICDQIVTEIAAFPSQAAARGAAIASGCPRQGQRAPLRGSTLPPGSAPQLHP